MVMSGNERNEAGMGEIARQPREEMAAVQDWDDDKGRM